MKNNSNSFSQIKNTIFHNDTLEGCSIQLKYVKVAGTLGLIFPPPRSTTVCEENPSYLPGCLFVHKKSSFLELPGSAKLKTCQIMWKRRYYFLSPPPATYPKPYWFCKNSCTSMLNWVIKSLVRWKRTSLCGRLAGGLTGSPVCWLEPGWLRPIGGGTSLPHQLGEGRRTVCLSLSQGWGEEQDLKGN